MKKTLLYILLIALIAGGAYWLGTRQNTAAPKEAAKIAAPAPKPVAKTLPPFDPKNASYPDIDDLPVTLVNGQADTLAEPGSQETVTTQYFGNAASGDLNGDGIADPAFILTQYGAGTGIFYYVAAAVSSGNSYKATNAVFIGDRIKPQTTEVRDGQVLVNYLDRKADDAMTEDPTVSKTMRLKISASKLGKI